jgi:hypothetical protein
LSSRGLISRWLGRIVAIPVVRLARNSPYPPAQPGILKSRSAARLNSVRRRPHSGACLTVEVAKQQRTQAIATASVIRPFDDREFLAGGALDLEPIAATAGSIRRVTVL